MSLSSLFSFLVEKWLVELPYNVCMYGLSDRPGVFYTPLAGKIYFIRLVHISGSVGCGIRQKANWGCHSNIETILTDKDKNVVYPEDQRARAYQLFGFSKNSPELMLKFTTPLVVAAGQEYQVWFLEDLTDIYEDNNNPGPSCMKVIYLFSLWYGTNEWGRYESTKRAPGNENHMRS